MSTSFMYHAFGMKGYTYKRQDFLAGNIIFKVQPKPRLIKCSHCKSKEVTQRGQFERWVKTVPIGNKPVWIVISAPRVKCRRCGFVRRIDSQIAERRRWYTKAFERLALMLSKSMTLKDVAEFLEVGWDAVKDIKKRYLSRKFGKPRLKDLKYIAIDEFSMRKNHKYMTVVLDIVSGAAVYVAEGKEAEALKPFWKRLKCSGARIEGVATDMSKAYISSVLKNLPGTPIVFDHFHVVKLMNEKLSKIRRNLHKELSRAGEKSVLKGVRWVLLKNPENLDPNRDEKKRLEEALEMNKPLAMAYYMKEDLRQIWSQPNKKQATKILDNWIARAEASGVYHLMKMGRTLSKYRHGILAYYDHPISTGPLEGLNNKIKTMKRQAYGFRDMEFFKLRILSLHESKYALTG
ncbi:MAG: ISL3 family transposase [Desulfonatronovibrio sp.]